MLLKIKKSENWKGPFGNSSKAVLIMWREWVSALHYLRSDYKIRKKRQHMKNSVKSPDSLQKWGDS